MEGEAKTPSTSPTVVVATSMASTSSGATSPMPIPIDAKEGEDKTNLIVNYIPLMLTEDSLRELFRSFGSIVQCKIVKDKSTGNSLGYGFVKFETAASAHAAISTLNGYALEGKRLKVGIARPPTSHLQTNLYVSGLPLSYGKPELTALVASFGKVLECRVLHDAATKQPRGVGFARLDTHDGALAAINSLNDTQIPGSKLTIVCKFADQPNNLPKRLQPGALTNVYGGQGGVAPDGSNGGGYRFNPMAQGGRQPNGHHAHHAHANGGGWGQFVPQQQGGNTGGLLTSAPTSAPTAAAPATGGAPVTTAPPAGADSNGMDFMGAAGAYSGICLFVYHLPPTCNETQLAQLFGTYGQVLSAKVMKDLQTGLNKGYGFVNMASGDQAQTAISGLNGYRMGTKYLKVSHKTKADEKQFGMPSAGAGMHHGGGGMGGMHHGGGGHHMHHGGGGHAGHHGGHHAHHAYHGGAPGGAPSYSAAAAGGVTSSGFPAMPTGTYNM